MTETIGRKSPFFYVPHLFVGSLRNLVILLLLGFIVIRAPSSLGDGGLIGRHLPMLSQYAWIIRIGSILAMFGVMIFSALPYLRQARVHYRVSAEKVRMDSGFLDKNSIQVPMRSIQDIQVHRSLWARMTGYAHIEVDTSVRPIYFYGVPDHVAQAIQDNWTQRKMTA